MQNTRSRRRSRERCLYETLIDGKWHSTAELVRAVGHTFAVAKYRLIHQHNLVIEKRREPHTGAYHYRLGRD